MKNEDVLFRTELTNKNVGSRSGKKRNDLNRVKCVIQDGPMKALLRKRMK